LSATHLDVDTEGRYPPVHDVPTDGRSCFLRIEGRQVHYLEWGHPSMPAVVLLHGAGQSSYMWEELGATLAPRCYVVAPDLPDHGDSDPFPDDRWSRFALADAIYEFLGSLGIRSGAFVGGSFGGITAITLAVNHPGLLQSLVLIDVAPRMQAMGSARLAKFFMRREPFETLEHAAADISEFMGRRRPIRLESLTRNLRRRPDGRWVWKHGLAYHPQPEAELDANGGQSRSPWIEGLDEDAKALTFPVLLLRGGHSDLLSDEAANEFVESLTHGEMAIVGAAGHLAIGDNPATSVALINDFVLRHPPTIGRA
jgi:pimeloyl-ACP methyl ester carboxylesterase